MSTNSPGGLSAIRFYPVSWWKSVGPNPEAEGQSNFTTHAAPRVKTKVPSFFSPVGIGNEQSIEQAGIDSKIGSAQTGNGRSEFC